MADGPRYQRIADLLREEIRNGTYKPGDRLPSHNDLADQMRGMEQVLAELRLPDEQRPKNRGGSK